MKVKLLLTINDKISMEFRTMALKRFKNVKGMLSIAGEEAINDWIKKQNRSSK